MVSHTWSREEQPHFSRWGSTAIQRAVAYKLSLSKLTFCSYQVIYLTWPSWWNHEGTWSTSHTPCKNTSVIVITVITYAAKNLILPQLLPTNYDIAPNNSLGINLLRDKHLQRNKMSFFLLKKGVMGLFEQMLFSKIRMVAFLNQGLIQGKELFKTQAQVMILRAKP